MIPILSSVAAMAGDYDAWFCDIWGVMHNGQTAFSEAVEACRKYRSVGGSHGEGGVVILLTNAPRPAYSVQEQLREFGVPDDCYDAIVSSGDVAQHLIRRHKNQPIFHLGPARDHAVIDEAGIEPVEFDSAEIILLTGLMDDEVEGPEDYRQMFEEAVGRDLVMICANPDLQVERGNRLVYCAGALAQLYVQLGGVVEYAGKPYMPIYDLAQKRLAQVAGREIERGGIICIGDGLKTDMPGAFKAGLDALFVASALHAGDGLDGGLIEAMFADLAGEPVGGVERLSW